MSAVQIHEGMSVLANHLFLAGGGTPVLAIDFFINNFTPLHTSHLADFTWLTLSPWTPATTSGIATATNVDQGDGSDLGYGSGIFQQIDDYAGADVTIYGWALRDTANNVVILAEKYVTPYLVPHTGGMIVAPVRFIQGHYAP